jgi:hypothetical protein
MEAGVPMPDIEVIRARWRRWRRRERLLDPEAEDFGAGGLARLIPEGTSHLLILPGDPEADVVDFDQELWEW